ncbi:MAG: ATP-grasp domain-containing protein [Thermomicrobiales bacterium]
MATVSVLCTRVRMEEKQIIAALATAGLPTLPLDPSRLPLPVGPVPPGPSASTADGVIVDRCQNRAVAVAVLAVLRPSGATILDAGIAASGDRLAVASTLAAAGVPRPHTQLVCSEESALAALHDVGYPATLLLLTPGASEILMLDHDVAEAILEHRGVLGAKHDVVMLVQAGVPLAEERATVLVVDGRAVGIVGAVRHAAYPARFAGIAEAAAAVLGASVAGVEVALTAAGPVVWDVHPAPDFRSAVPCGRLSVAEAIAASVARALGEQPCFPAVRVEVESAGRREVTDDVALTA